MKILEIKFKNLNSLYGEWKIDLSSSEYSSSGIFAIIGPTGGGKSTILDAVCLALYGATPRLGKITKNNNEIMSRQTGDCYAEVIFESQIGKFCCTWSQHRAHKKATGNMTDYKHEISNANNGKILESKKRNVAKTIEEKTGMNFERFTRSIFLAQGSFASFLQASPDERSPILEQITGSTIYTKISKKAHECYKNEQEKIKILLAETSGITIMSHEEEYKTINDLIEIQKSKKDISLKYHKTKKATQWLKQIGKLSSEINEIHTKHSSIIIKINNFKPRKIKLNFAKKALKLDGEFTALNSIRHRNNINRQYLESNEKKLHEIKLDLPLKEKLLKINQLNIFRIKQEQKIQKPMFLTVRKIDSEISDTIEIVKIAEAEYNTIFNKIKKNKKEQTRYIKSQEKTQIEFQHIKQYLLNNSNDTYLVTHLTGITEQINSMQNISQKIKSGENELETVRNDLNVIFKKYNEHKRKITSLKAEHNLACNKIIRKNEEFKLITGNKSFNDHQIKDDSLMLKIAFLKYKIFLETERKNLKNGSICPLCGSTEHPFVEYNSTIIDNNKHRIIDSLKLIKKVEQLEISLRNLEREERKAAKKLLDSEMLQSKLAYKKENLQINLRRSKNNMNTLNKELITIRESVLSKLKPLGIIELQNKNFTSILSNLKDRLEQWQRYQYKNSLLEKRHNKLDSELKRLDGVIDTLSDSLKEKQKIINNFNIKIKRLASKRKSLYGSKNPNEEEETTEKRLLKAEKTAKDAQTNIDKSKKEIDKTKTRIDTLRNNITNETLVLNKLKKTFNNNLIEAGFENEKSFIGCHLPPDEFNQLEQEAICLDITQTDLLTLQKDREKRLVSELNKKITELSLKDLKKVESEFEEVLKKIGENIGAVKQKLYDNKSAKSKLHIREDLILSQKKECEKWAKIHCLIGSSDGKKYRNFAQGLTFELMISHANMELKKMTDRYILIHDNTTPLELNVMDNYQAGEIRSTKNLSGGESFIVSLSLALGLSKMASRKVRVDSLFLDEGFGTLDEDSLDTALEALTGLQQNGKLIGIISHVQTLKERINTQIRIIPISGGKSIISGPGCSNITQYL